MSDGEFQIPIENRDTIRSVPIIFEEEIVSEEYYYNMKKLEEEYCYEQIYMEEI